MPSVRFILPDESVVHVPAWVTDHASFLRWAASDEAPERGKIGYLHGTVWLDNTMEQIFHNLIKQAVSQDILNWNRQHKLGNYYSDGMSYSNSALEFTTVPDGIFVSHDSLKHGLVSRDKGIRSTRLEGSPDMVLEVINRSSVSKDLNDLRDLYFEAGVKEYWLIDSRVDQPELLILNRSDSGFVDEVNVDGWSSSQVLQALCRLVVNIEREEIVLEMK